MFLHCPICMCESMLFTHKMKFTKELDIITISCNHFCDWSQDVCLTSRDDN
jgi:hypothetical protein